MEVHAAVPLFLQGYFSTCDRSPKTVAAYTTDLRQFVAALPKAMTLEAVTPDILEEWAARLKENQYASASIRRKFATLRVFFHYWVRRGELDLSPMRLVRLDLARERKLPKVLSAEEVQRILNQARQEVGPLPDEPLISTAQPYLALRNLAILELLFATGIRVGELVAIRLDHWQEHNKAFRIQGKGARERLALLCDSRSQSTLSIYLRHRRSIPASTSALLLNAFSKPLSTQGVSNVIACITARAGFSRHVTPHMFRHSVATLLLNGGANLRVVQEFLGHSSVITTQRYAHIDSSMMVSSMKKFHPNNLLVK
ncbi:MAG: tyrosine-type recombinase/integrase [Acidobacteriota bacterium]